MDLGLPSLCMNSHIGERAHRGLKGLVSYPKEFPSFVQGRIGNKQPPQFTPRLCVGASVLTRLKPCLSLFVPLPEPVHCNPREKHPLSNAFEEDFQELIDRVSMKEEKG